MTALVTSEAVREAPASLRGAAPQFEEECDFRPIAGALGTLGRAGEGLSFGKGSAKWLKILLAILGPGLIVMVGDNDAGGFSTYAQAGQDYGTALLWTLLFLVPVLYVNQEMVLRLGAVTGVGHARLILKRFGRFWGAFSIIDLFFLNALTIVTEFIGIDLALAYLGLSRPLGVALAAGLIMLAAGTGSFRRFERFALFLVLGSLLLIPVFLALHPAPAQMAADFFVPRLPEGGKLSEVMLLIVAVVGTTIAPWQLFFQQSYVIDKGITARFIAYERADLWIGIALVTIGAAAIMAIAAAAFAGRPEFGHFLDTGAVAAGIGAAAGRAAGVLFALALIDACLIGASAVSLSTAYAIGDVFRLSHSLHKKPTEAKAFYAVYGGLVALAAALVLTPGMPLGLLTNAVQTLAGLLLPSATVFLLFLCNDKAVLGPWTNGRALNLFTGAVIAALVLLSLVLTASVLFPALGERAILAILGGGAFAFLLMAFAGGLGRGSAEPAAQSARRANWKMPPLESLPPLPLGRGERLWLVVLRLYLLAALSLILARILALAFGAF